MRKLIVIVMILGTTGAYAAEATHYLDLVNTAQDSITAVAFAPSGSDRFVALDVGVLHGGGNATTIALATAAGREGCLQDLRVGFANGRVLLQRNFDVCRYRSYHTGRYLRGSSQTVVASVP